MFAYLNCYKNKKVDILITRPQHNKHIGSSFIIISEYPAACDEDSDVIYVQFSEFEEFNFFIIMISGNMHDAGAL